MASKEKTTVKVILESSWNEGALTVKISDGEDRVGITEKVV